MPDEIIAGEEGAGSEEEVQGSTTLTDEADKGEGSDDGDKGEEGKGSEEKSGEGEKNSEGEADKKSEDGDADKGKDSAPEEYEAFTVPEGVDIAPEHLEKFTPLLKDLDASQDQAQKLVDLQVALTAEFVTGQEKAWQDQQATWVEAGETDEEFGGAKYDESISVAKSAIRELGGPALMLALEQTKAGSHPEIIRAFYKIGKAMKEDSVTFGGGANASQKSLADRVYPNQGK